MASESTLVTIMNIITDSDFKRLLELAADNRSKKNDFTFYDVYRKRDESEFAKTLKALNKMLIFYLEKCSNYGKIEWGSADSEGFSDVGQVIQAAIDIAMTSFELKFAPSESLLQMVLFLNGILPEIPSSDDNLKNNIAHLCEKLYNLNFIDKCEYFLCNVIIYLLRRTLEIKAFKTDVKRLYALRNVIHTIIIIKHSSSIEIWLLLMKCASSKFYLSIPEGQKIIAMSMTIDADHTIEIHDVLKDQLPDFTTKIAVAYGRIYYEAWFYAVKTGNHELKHAFEITCLQDYILLAIRPTTKPYLHVVRKLLGQFHLQKKDFEVAKMLYLLYQPLLWRYIKNPDGLIRANACQLFLDIFPLEDPEENIVDTTLELNDQLLMIKDLLVDEYPIVRVTTVVGICLSMSINWEVFPEEILKTYFRIIVNDLSCDSSCEEVRVAVIKGIKVLLENPLTIPTMQIILPKLHGLFHDISKNVRIAFCQLLLRIKNILAIKYFDVVPLRHLLARMEDDCHSVRKCITNLIYNSYFPKGEDTKIWIGRCIEIFKSQPAAARVMFTYVAALLGLEDSVRFMVQAVKAVHFYVRTTHKSKSSVKSRKSVEKAITVPSSCISLADIGFDDADIVCALIDCLSVMWLSLKGSLNEPENKSILKILIGKTGPPLSDLCLHYKNVAVWKSIFYLSSFLPAYVVPSVSSLCFWKLKNLPSNTEYSDFTIVLESLCNQNQATELLELLIDWIALGFDDSFAPPIKRRKNEEVGEEFMYNDVPKPYLANKMLDAMISHRSMQKAVLMCIDPLKNILGFFDSIKAKLESSDANEMDEIEADFLKLLMFNLLRISVLVQSEMDTINTQFVNDVAYWAEKKLVNILRTSNFSSSDAFTELVCSLCEHLCAVVSDMTGLGYCDPDSTFYFHIFLKLLTSNWGFRFAVITSKFLFKYAASGQYLYLEDNESVMLRHLMHYFCKIVVDGFSKESLFHQICENDLKKMQMSVCGAIQIIFSHVSTLSLPVSAVFKSVIRTVLNSIMNQTSRIVIKMGNESFQKITFPKQGTFFLSVWTSKPNLIIFYMKYFNQCYKEYYRDENLTNENRIQFWISCYVLLYNIMKPRSLLQPVLHEIRNLLIEMDKTLRGIYPQKMDYDVIDPDEKENYLKRQTFEKFCYSEFRRLKVLHFSKVKNLTPRLDKELESKPAP